MTIVTHPETHSDDDPPMETLQQQGHEELRAVFERLYGLLNEHDAAHVPAIFSEDIVFRDDAWPETIRGHREMEGFLRAIWRAMPDLRFELLEGPFLAQDGRVAARVGLTGTLNGPLEPPGFAPTGRPLVLEFAGFYTFEGERIREGRIIINMQEAGIQIGALPARGSRAEQVAVRMQRLLALGLRARA